MDILLLISIASLLVVLIVGITWFSKRGTKKAQRDGAPAARGQEAVRRAGVRGVRQRRAPARVVEEPQQHEDNANEDDDETPAEESTDLSKVGAKKRAKLEAKAERKAQREIEGREREERKRRDQQQQEERDKQSALEREEERKQEEAERKAREEKERREQEEYLKLKEAFSIEGEGYEEKDEEAERNLLQEFVDYIKSSKVVLLEDLAQQFNLRTTHAIERIQQMLSDGILSGVIDDRGKFIYIAREELEAVAKFIRQRGRVSIAELAEKSNDLINLNPGTQCKPVEA
ncbi:DDRGK domain-containing protein 1 [Copidosoma floridanum]|uniref:DDRGK domain-containing protein 1 n=1 Tax=Copidosoma floridanum TaxID=29053 RepID=UPI0006C945C6|nr:DDRGK domain-containing protein 1 [Copidosoma floridanum]